MNTKRGILSIRWKTVVTAWLFLILLQQFYIQPTIWYSCVGISWTLYTGVGLNSAFIEMCFHDISGWDVVLLIFSYSKRMMVNEKYFSVKWQQTVFLSWPKMYQIPKQIMRNASEGAPCPKLNWLLFMSASVQLVRQDNTTLFRHQNEHVQKSIRRKQSKCSTK